MHEAVKQGAERIVRLNPCSAVGLQATGGQQTVRGWVPASRGSAEQAGRARDTCRQRQHKGTPKAASLLLAGWGLVLTTLSPAVRSAQTIMTLSRWRGQVDIAIQRWQRVRAVDALRAKAPRPLAEVWRHGPWLSALRRARRLRRLRGDMGGRLAQARGGTWWRVGGGCKRRWRP